ncbi:MAG TPA: phosphotransferase [Acidimicrobiales bacterium]|nr:phosphotransferase [Acidimicrobiales bacterium]
MSYLDRVVQREALADHDGRSGARVERGVLDDGTAVIVKTASPANDVTIALTGGVDRERLLWESGVFGRLAGAVAHPILEVTRVGEETITVMRDVGDTIPGWTRRMRARDCERIMAALAALHRVFLDDAPEVACRLELRLAALSPVTAQANAALGNPVLDAISDGWQRFFELVGGDVASAVASIHDDPTPLANAMRRGPVTLCHADLWPVNVALEPDQVVFLDWAIATAAPPALDLAVFLTGSASQMEPSREDAIAMFRAVSPAADDDAVALALLFGLADMGWNKALDATGHSDAATRARERADLDWWVTHGAAALDRALL